MSDSPVSGNTQAERLASGLRLTASDRPGVAQPVPERDVPERPWRGISLAAALITLALMAAWEWHWRAFGVDTGYYVNSDALWAIQRRRIDQGEGGATVILGASRMLFDVQLPVWERIAGHRPIQLALEGTSPMFALEDLANDPDFTGRLLVGVAPDVFFSGFEYRKGALGYYQHESPSQRAGQWLSMHLLEPHVAFLEPDFALAQQMKEELPWPARPGKRSFSGVRKLMDTEIDRNTHMWRKLETDAATREQARAVWAQDFGPPDSPPTDAQRAEWAKTLEDVFARAEKAVATLRARGVPVIFVRPPSTGDYLAYEDREFPRARTWDVLLQRTGAPGIHFQDYPQLQGLELPEWSHLSRADAEVFTAALYPIVVGIDPRYAQGR